MAPDKRQPRRPASPVPGAPIRTAPSSDDAHEVVFFRRHDSDDPRQPTPGRDFLNGCPTKVRTQRRHFRLFCLLDYKADGVEKPLLVVIDGRAKPFRTELPAKEYAAVRRLGEEYLARNPRSII